MCQTGSSFPHLLGRSFRFLFKALKAGSTTEWLEGYPFKDSAGDVYLIQVSEDNVLLPVRVNKNSLLRCVGYADYNGAPIFEGDVVEDMDGEKLAVVWDNYRGGWSGYQITDLSRPIGSFHDIFLRSDSVTPVLSNIYTDSPIEDRYIELRCSKALACNNNVIIGFPVFLHGNSLVRIIEPSEQVTGNINMFSESNCAVVDNVFLSSGKNYKHSNEIFEGDMIDVFGTQFFVDFSDDYWNIKPINKDSLSLNLWRILEA